MANVITAKPLESAVRDFMEMYIDQEARRIAEEYKAKALKDLEEAVRAAVTKTVVHFSRMISVKDGGDQICITISDKREAK